MKHDYTNQLRSRGFRMTPQRLAILQILQDASSHLSPGEIFEQVQQRLPGITEATVYRALSFLNQQNLILAAHIGSGQLVYEIAGHDHHHLICRACGYTHEIEHEMLQALYQQFQQKTGFQIDSIHVTFFGLCPECQNT
jgi:Fe2+ or Zn2+ uptake regulation protein